MSLQPFSPFTPQANIEPSLLIAEMSFLDEFGKAMVVDNTLQARLYNLGDSLQVGNTFRLDGTTTQDKIYVTANSAGVYYYIRVNPSEEYFTTNAIEIKWEAEYQGKKIEPYPTVRHLFLTGTNERILLPGMIRDWALRKLGFPELQVELDESQIAQSIDEALRHYNRFNPRIVSKTIPLPTNQLTVHELEEWGRGIVKVDFTWDDALTGGAFGGFGLYGWYYSNAGCYSFNRYVLSESFYKTFQKQTSQNPMWQWDPTQPNLLYLYTRNFYNYNATYQYYIDHRLEEINPSHHQIFMELTLAHIMIILGEIRSKYGDAIPTPTGEKALNGKDLIERGSKLKEEREKEIESFGFQVPPLRS